MTTSGGGNIQCLTAQASMNPTVANPTSTSSQSSSSLSTASTNVPTTLAQIQLPTTSSTASPSILHPISLATLTATAPKSLILNTNLNSTPSITTATSTTSIPLSTATTTTTTTTRLLNHPISIPSAAIIDTNKLIKSTSLNEANVAIPISSSTPTITSSSAIVPSTTISLTNLSKLTTTTTTTGSNQVPPSKITLQPIPNANNLVKNLLSNSASTTTSTNSNANGSNHSSLPASLASNAQNLLNTTAPSNQNSTAILNAAAAAQAAASYYNLITPSNNSEINNNNNNNNNGSKLTHTIVTTLPTATISNVKTSGSISSTPATSNTNQINIPQPKIILSNSSSSNSLATNATITTTTPTIARTILSNSNSSPASFATLIGLDSSKISLKTTNISTNSSTASTNATNGSIGTGINIKSLSPTVSSLSTTSIIDTNSSTTSNTNHSSASSSKITQLTRNLQTQSGSNGSQQQAHSSPSVISKKLNVNTKIAQPTYNSISTAPTIAQLYTANNNNSNNTNSSNVNPIQFHIKNVTTQATSAVTSPQLIQSLQPIRLIANNNQSVINSNASQATTVTLANNMFAANNSNFHHLLNNNSLNTISNSNVNTNNGNSSSNGTVPLTTTATVLNLNTQQVQPQSTTTTVNIASPTSSPIKPNIIRKPRRDSPSHTSLSSGSPFASSSLIKDIKPPVFKTDNNNNAGSINSANISSKVISNNISSSSSSLPSSSSASSSSSSASSSSSTATGEQTIINLTSASNPAHILALQQKPNAHMAKLIVENDKFFLLNQPSSSTQPTSSTCTSLNVQQPQANETTNTTVNQSQTTAPNRKRRKQEFKLGASDEPLVSYTMPTTNLLDTGRYLNENTNRLNQHSSTHSLVKSSQRISKTFNSKQNKNLPNGVAVIADYEEMQVMVNTNRCSPGSSSIGSCQDTVNTCDDECKSAKQPRLSQNQGGNEQNFQLNRNTDCADDDDDDDSEQINYLDEERQYTELINGNENSIDSFLDDKQVEMLSKEFKYTCSNGLKWSAKPRAGSIPIRSIANSYKPNWKPNQHHYEKYSDIKLKDLVNQNPLKASQSSQGQLSPTCTSNQTNLITHKDLVDNLSEWRFHYVISQVNSLIDYENESMQLIEELDELLNNSDEFKLKYCNITDAMPNKNTINNSFTGFNEISFKLKESIKANAQRHKYVNEQLDETHNLIKKLLQHKEKFKNYLLTSSFSSNHQKNSISNIDNIANVNNSANGVNNVTNAKNGSTKKSIVSCGVERSEKKKKALKRHSSKNSNELN